MHNREQEYTIDDYLKAFNDLYITERSKHIQQRPNGLYRHVDNYPLSDGIIKEHLKMKKTVGVFSGENNAKFITFDVDFEHNIVKAQQVARELIQTLVEDYFIKREQILASFSGSKGFHITLFIDGVITPRQAESFYNIVREELGYTKREIEFRASFGSGVKLPLSINKKSGKRQHFVNLDTLKEISDTAIFQVEKMDKQLFLDYLEEFKEDNASESGLDDKQIEDFKKVVARTNLDIEVDYESMIMKMLEENQLIYADSRHDSTLKMLIFLSQQGYTEKDAVAVVSRVIENTFINARNLISADKTLSYCLSEVKRIWKYACKYSLGETAKKNITVYDAEILKVLTPKKIHLKQLLFILLVHSKKHVKKDGTFFMTYKKMNEYGATDNRTRALKYLMELEEMGLIEIVARDRKQKNSEHSLPNVYRVNIHCVSEKFIELDVSSVKELPFVETVATVIPQELLKQLITKKQFENSFKEHYKEQIIS